jgi:acyl-CoA synthetase (AMP-forming)/AMP-acid ligase II
MANAPSASSGNDAVTEKLRIELGQHHRSLLAMTIPQALDWAAATWSGKVAFSFVHASDVLTYRQLAESVRRLRTGLVSLGLRPGDRVGIMIPNQLEFPLAWLSVIDAGAVAVPLNPKYTQREIEFVLRDTEANWLIATHELLSKHNMAMLAPVPGTHVVVAGGAVPGAHRFGDLMATPGEPRRHEAGRRDLVGIQFTSGSTGLPKGCMLTHEYWLEMGTYSAALFFDPQHLLADHPFYYMQNQAYFMMALASGGQLHVTPGLSRSRFMSWLLDHDIDFAWIDEGMLDYPPSDADHQLKLKHAPVAAIPPVLHRPLETRFGLKARDWYASTEVGSGTFVPWERDDLVGSGSMGLCWPTRETKIVDADLVELPSGAAGEMLIRGPGMMLGYWNRPDTNAKLMLPGGWFRTGDIVRKDPDGLHFYIGRTRDIIRRSGENIAAVEVEQQILAMPEVMDVAVVPVPDHDRDEEAKAIIVLHPGSPLGAMDIVAWASERLAPFKVPRYIEFRLELPRTGNGKVAKSQLRNEPPFAEGVIDTRKAQASR